MSNSSEGTGNGADTSFDYDVETSKEAVNVWLSVTNELGTGLVDLIDWCSHEVPSTPAEEQSPRSRWAPLAVGGNNVDGQAVALLSESAQLFLRVLEHAVDVAPSKSGRWSTLIGTPLGDALNSTRSVLNFLRQWREKLNGPEVRTANCLSGIEAFTTALRANNGLISWAQDNIPNRFEVLNRAGQIDGYRLYLIAEVAEQSAKRLAQIERTAEARSSAIASVETAVRASAGVVAEGTAAREFDAYAQQQTTVGRRWFILTCLLLAIVAAIGVLLVQGVQQHSWQDLVAHLVVAGPVAGLATYAARESSRRRESGERARHVATQLKTIDAYRAQLPDDRAGDLLADFGRYVYGPYTSPGDNLLHSLPPEMLDAAVKVVKK